ncbi:MAG: MBL fold metallo-hydrolase [Syntrophomonadaceae bacterium]|nr:MBL fold metallo-hydrolase [Syntrophomonadaceae bacterium]MDH7497007.1 MBL fold metallo-hydrolase [Syntrophomonadaceae bacterium]
MKIFWYGHACFLLQSEGCRLVTDPFGPEVGYPMPGLSADIVTVSHEHYDHNAVKAVRGKPTVIRGAGSHEAAGVRVTGIPTYHDRSHGKERGTNTVFIIEMEGIRIVHLGDLGHVLSFEQVEGIGAVDVLLVPVGGRFTIDAEEAAATVSQLRPRITIPMHFQTPHLSFELAPVEGFLRRFERVTKVPYLEIDADKLDEEQRVVVLDYLHPAR